MSFTDLQKERPPEAAEAAGPDPVPEGPSEDKPVLIEGSGEKIVKVRRCPKTNRDIELCYETFGDPKNEPLVMISGLGTQLIAMRKELCSQLAAKHYVIRFDNRDCGRSTHLDDIPIPNPIKLKLRLWFGREIKESEVPYTLKDMADDVIGLIDALKLEKVHIFGTSMGGMIGQELCIHYPHRIKSFTCVFSSHSGRGQPEASLWTQLRFISKPKDESFEGKVNHSMWLFKTSFCSQTYWNEEFIRNYIVESLKRCDNQIGAGRHLSAVMQAASTDNRMNALKKCAVPTLICHGDKDQIIPIQHAHNLHKIIPNSRLYILENVGHELPLAIYPGLTKEIFKLTSEQKSN